jgi:hypothetical protein
MGCKVTKSIDAEEPMEPEIVECKIKHNDHKLSETYGERKTPMENLQRSFSENLVKKDKENMTAYSTLEKKELGSEEQKHAKLIVWLQNLLQGTISEEEVTVFGKDVVVVD